MNPLEDDRIRLRDVRYGFQQLGLHRIQLRVIGLHRIQLRVIGGNDRAVRAYAKAGFVEEGRSRECLFRDGRWHDEIQMGILAREFQALQTQLSRS